MLNAFRHQRTIHSYRTNTSNNNSISAQRLSASTNDSRSKLEAYQSWTETVLNAFRHQRTIHPPTSRRGQVPSRSAQRLSASTNDSRDPRHLTWREARRCSTPFGINERFTRTLGKLSNKIAGVCSTPFGINERFTMAKFDGLIEAFTCSTPFGINERFTSAREFSGHCLTYVLNAFRHQRTIHQNTHLVRRPDGFVLNAFRHQRTIHSAKGQAGALGLPGAQRLSASTNDSPTVRQNDRSLIGMCSTPFGINERFTRVPS